jgi:hypothetical protein
MTMVIPAISFSRLHPSLRRFSADFLALILSDTHEGLNVEFFIFACNHCQHLLTNDEYKKGKEIWASDTPEELG